MSLWTDVDVWPDARSLAGDAKADTVVVRAGIAGLSTAYELAQRGHSVVVLERGRIGMDQTVRTTAHLASDSDDSFEGLISARGLDAAKLFYASHAAAIDRIEAIETAEKIACHFRRGCHLHWNSSERCWDCPCQGSQISPDGAVLQGPAITPLERVRS